MLASLAQHSQVPCLRFLLLLRLYFLLSSVLSRVSCVTPNEDSFVLCRRYFHFKIPSKEQQDMARKGNECGVNAVAEVTTGDTAMR